MLQWLIGDVEVEIHVVIGLSLMWVDFMEVFFFALHQHEFDVAIALFRCCMNLNGCCMKQSNDVAAGSLLFPSRYFDVFWYLFFYVANIIFFTLQMCIFNVVTECPIKTFIGRPCASNAVSISPFF